MARFKPIPFLLLSVFLPLVHFPIVKTRAQLLPIVSPNGNVSSSETQTYIVHVDGLEDADLLSYEDRESWYLSFLPNTTLDSGEPRLVYSYIHVLNGFAARLTPAELKAMESMEGFLYAEPPRMYRLGTTYTPQFLELNQYGNSVWEKSNGGEGVIIGIIDTGIVPDHPSFDDSGMPPPPVRWRGCCQFKVKFCDRFAPSFCNNKLLGARLPFTGSPLDKDGHGSHVAGIAAGVPVYNADVLGQAKGTAVGMAPKAHLAVYKACDDKGCSNINILSAIDMAIEDGVDILSMSITGGFEKFWASGVMRGAFVAMEKRGILSSTCAGNDGWIPLKVSNDAPWVMTVGASTTDRVIRVVLQLGNGMELYGESAYQPKDYKSPWLPIAYPGRIDTDAKKSCMTGSLDDEDVKGKMVLCGEMNSLRLDKGRTVKEAQGEALVVLNQKWNGFTTWAEAHVLPAAHLSHVDSLKIVNYALTDPDAKARLVFKGTHFNQRKAPAVTDFSSRGPSTINRGIIKPDIIGPGSNILAAWANEVGPDASGPSTTAFNFASGCSMATPHLAGIAALIKSIHQDWSPAAIKSAIMTTANTLDHEGQPIVDEKSNTLEQASYFAMGAGHVNPSKAIDPGLVYDVDADDYIRYLCGMYNDVDVMKIIKRAVKCRTLKTIPAEELNYPSVMVSLSSSSEKTITRVVTYVGDEASADYKVKDIVHPEGTSMEINPKELNFSSPNKKQAFTVKFTKTGNAPGKQYTEGQFTWVSGNHRVRSPVVVQHY